MSDQRSSELYPLTVICAHCGTGHLDTPGDYGDCRKCGKTLPGMVGFAPGEAEAIVAAVEPGIKRMARKLWAEHPNNPANRRA